MEGESFVYVEDNKYSDRPSLQSRPHGSLVGDKVLTAQETHVYDTVMGIVDQNNELKRILIDHNQQFQLRVQYMKHCKDEYDKKVADLEKENANKNKQIKRLEGELSLLNKSSGTMDIYKNQIIEILEKMTQLVKQPLEPLDGELRQLNEIIQDFTYQENGGYVIVSGGHKAIKVSIDKKLREMESFKSIEAKEIRENFESLQDICKKQESLNESSTEKKVSLKEYVVLKTNFEELVSEMELMNKVKDENEDLQQKVVNMGREKDTLEKKLRYTEERLQSLELQSFELPEQETLKKDLDALKKDLNSKNRMIQQLKSDLQETEACLERSDIEHNNVNKKQEEKIAELDGIVNKLSSEKEEISRKLKMREKEIKQIRKRETKDCKEIDELKGENIQLKQELSKIQGNDESLMNSPITPVPKPRQDKNISVSSLEESFELNSSFELSLCKEDETNQIKELQTCISQLEVEKKELENQITDLQEKLRNESEANSLLQTELTQNLTAHSQDDKLKEHMEQLSNELLQEQREKESLHREMEEQRIQQQEDREKLKKIANQKDEYYERLKSFINIKDENSKIEKALEESTIENTSLRQNLQTSFLQNEEMRKSLQETKDIVIVLQSENTGLSREIKSYNAKIAQLSEDIQAHQLQATIYQSDFRAEREAREKQEKELSRLRQELENSQAQTDKYKDEVRKAGQQQFENIRNRQMQHSPINTAGPTFNSGFNQANQNFGQHNPKVNNPNYGHHANRQRPGSGYQNYDQYSGPASVPYTKSNTSDALALQPCPKCNDMFPDVQTLEIHLMDCLDD